MRRRFFTLDVFTTRRFAGNPLAVVLESEGLDTAAMQTVAREFNLPETVFAFAPADPRRRARLRIFTPARELPFAGHPTVGAAVLMAHLDGGPQMREIVLDEEIGPVACTVTPRPDGGSATFGIPRLPEKGGPVTDVANLQLVLNLDQADIGFDRFTPESWSAGNAFAYVPVRSLDAMAKARPDLSRWKDVFPDDGPTGAYLFCGDVVDPSAAFHTRMFAPKMGIIQDPATGSAAATFAGVLAASGRYADGEHAATLEQGVEMGRPSLIRLTLNIRGGKLATATVGGDAVLVSEGSIEA